ncbi:hypothetical protein [Paenimyroides aestuarii]|uniref:Uncharacterized protein n=1 Tax=Paenimyroides aestuarii TaxID=2968490 RepID=A0ABY5NVL0_9FLAO|nr:hypothetical protein [Paenimyroides aestuarii]UUV22641.1 hypothetical protein NPX36_06250 [Paenimyroides aestuarii]
MKAIKIINTIAIGTPLVLLLMEMIIRDGGFAMYALLSTMFTGFVQVVLGIFLLIKFPKYMHYQIYLTAVVGYFALWFIGSELNFQDSFSYFLFSVPPCLAVYLSILIYSRSNNELSQ